MTSKEFVAFLKGLAIGINDASRSSSLPICTLRPAKIAINCKI